MKKIALILAAMGALFLVAGMAMGAGGVMKIESKQGVGKYLTDSEGKTLYWFKKDGMGKSTCMAGCLARWPIYYQEKVMAPKGLKAKDFGTITREDGKKQTTFRGYPLYYWMGDMAAGDMKGQGMGGMWSVVNPDDFPPK
ncbi:MAG: hypothetical protein PHY31_06800 [Smithellaceae bacterium]|nr:hypothetical protein [Smithellaceae bacterium]